MKTFEQKKQMAAEEHASEPTIALDTVSNTYRQQRIGDVKFGYTRALADIAGDERLKLAKDFLVKVLASDKSYGHVGLSHSYYMEGDPIVARLESLLAEIKEGAK